MAIDCNDGVLFDGGKPSQTLTDVGPRVISHPGEGQIRDFKNLVRRRWIWRRGRKMWEEKRSGICVLTLMTCQSMSSYLISNRILIDSPFGGYLGRSIIKTLMGFLIRLYEL